MRFCIRLNVNDDGIVTTVQGIYKGTNPKYSRILESDERPFNEIAAGPEYVPDIGDYICFKRIYIRWNDEPLNIEKYKIPIKQLTFTSSFGYYVVNGIRGLQSC